MVAYESFRNSLIIRKEKTKETNKRASRLDKLIAVPFNHLPVSGTVGDILVLFSSGESSGTGTSLYKINKK